MGKKKGPAARAAISLAPSSDASQDRLVADEATTVHHDGGTCVTYVASSGSEYTIDIAIMEQLNIQTGTRRRVFRHEEPGKFCWNKWQFEAATAGCRHYTPPKCVAITLEERYKAFQKERGGGSIPQRWRCTIVEFDETTLWELMHGLEKKYGDKNSEEAANRNTSPELVQTFTDESAHRSPVERPPEHLSGTADEAGQRLLTKKTRDLGDDASDQMFVMARAVANDESLQQVLAERVLRAQWTDKQLAQAVSCLLRIGWRPVPTDCRLVALSSGSLALLRLLLDTGVDVCGLVLFEPGQKKGKRSQKEGSWVQRSKNTLRALMGRGAVLGDDAPRSKLLKKLEEDGYILWVERALDGLGRAHPELPDCVFHRLRVFC